MGAFESGTSHDLSGTFTSAVIAFVRYGGEEGRSPIADLGIAPP